MNATGSTGPAGPGEGSRARDLGERAGEEAQGLLPVIGDALDGFWDGVRLVPPEAGPDGSTEAYRIAYEVGSFIPEALAALWDFLVGFVSALFG